MVLRAINVNKFLYHITWYSDIQSSVLTFISHHMVLSAIKEVLLVRCLITQTAPALVNTLHACLI